MTTGFPDWTQRIFANADNSEQSKASVTATAGTVTWTQRIRFAMIYNDGPNAVHAVTDAVSTTDGFKIPSGAYCMIPVSHDAISMICDSGGTATVYLWGFY